MFLNASDWERSEHLRKEGPSGVSGITTTTDYELEGIERWLNNAKKMAKASKAAGHNNVLSEGNAVTTLSRSRPDNFSETHAPPPANLITTPSSDSGQNLPYLRKNCGIPAPS
ncbi:hypothetical protein CRE_16428 [Caenorhabditis remanei]|uniref:Uncharacterized protein n=1 Tax=Caenorhabditis remanei TaxID=31234 RepID=E3NF78_CAERE|nr:hypothetical protein CRE_16428 [Caenorhabditis remanei]